MSFDLNADINVDRGYFLEMMSGALTFHFGVGFATMGRSICEA
ncbi:hypothetical protein ANCDUO_27227 [Ancylostoma duodenale]|uniref:Uncharacterized protein n=1 Tax=Ancylostoma duodenale TaxID=51022 RepID=A0A0C2F762_9BILA|nr:hypothetical protein ANCDUO_27227 [Ancylostoma duodenale]